MTVTQADTRQTGSMFSAELLEHGFFPLIGTTDPGEMVFEIGLWLAGLESFLNQRTQLFAEKGRVNDALRDWTKEFRLTHSALILCSKLIFRLRKNLAIHTDAQNIVDVGDLDDLAGELREVIILNDSFIESGQARFEEWKTWSNLLSDKLRASQSAQKFILYAESSDKDLLPEGLRILLYGKKMPFSDQADLYAIMTGFARVLKALSIVGRMLRNDEPLKHSLLIFSRIYDQTHELINYINNRLARFPKEEAELFNSLDGASYTASLELKKVYQQELTGIVAMRPAPSIYARIETAYALLNDSFQQIIAGFARLIEPSMEITEVFPNFQIKLQQSIILRSQLWRVLQAVKAAEQVPDGEPLEKLKNELTEFLSGSIRFLFYKDKETLERFNEEIIATGDKKDLVPILHRFGAYLETLFGQVNMRSVLFGHPFETE